MRHKLLILNFLNMKKLYSLFAAVVIAASVNAQTSVTYTFSGGNATEVLSGTIDSNLSFVTDKGATQNSPTFYTAAPAGVRIYSDRNTGDGNSFTISVAEGYEITGLSFTAAGAAYTPAVKYSVDGGTLATMPLTGTEYALTGITASTSLKFINAHSGGASNTQLRIPSFTVTYKEKPTMATGDVTAFKAALVKNTLVQNTINFAAASDVKIVNMNGQVVKTATVSATTSLDVASLPKGIYIVTGNVNGKAVSQKIIKQ